jgi:hypothetical protein
MTIFPRHLSVSAVQLYVRCPMQWRQRYVERVVTPDSRPQAWGKAFHKALEALHRGDDADLAWLSAWKSLGLGELQSPPPMPGKMHGLELLEAYRARGLDAARGEPERMFKLPFPSPKIPVPLLGYIDLAVPAERHFRDFKTTSGSSWTAEKVALEDQLHVYGWAYQQLYRHRAERALWVIFSTVTPTVTVLEGVPSPDGFRLFERVAEKVWDGIVNGRFDGCGSCVICAPPGEKAPANAPSFAWETTT